MNRSAAPRIALLALLLPTCAPRSSERQDTGLHDSAIQAPMPAASQVTVRILDVGQGDAALIENGGSRVIIDGGPDQNAFGKHLDRLGLNNNTIDVVLISHPHLDHYNGIRELFETARGITIRYVFESRDVSPNVTLAVLRDSILARAARGELVYRDTDDPCGNGTSVCTITMRGGARLHILRPNPAGSSANNRTTPAKLVGPDSASFSMWFGGDAEREAITWFDKTGYDTSPGMRAHLLKGNHHGSCNGVTRRYLELVRPNAVTFSLAASNEYGHVHQQTKLLLSELGIPWYRTDQNGELLITSPGTPGGGYAIEAGRGGVSATGPSDRAASQAGCPPS